VTKEFPKGTWPTKDDIQPIMFLSRLLTPAEKNYWPTELETAGLIWVIKKVRHLQKNQLMLPFGSVRRWKSHDKAVCQDDDVLFLSLSREKDYLDMLN
jgi:hypothetical protein